MNQLNSSVLLCLLGLIPTAARFFPATHLHHHWVNQVKEQIQLKINWEAKKEVVFQPHQSTV